MADVRISEAGPAAAVAVAALREALWPGDAGGHAEATATLGDCNPDRLMLIAHGGDVAIAFAEASIRRDYVNGCDGSPVVFLEGLYVAEEQRRRGIAQQLVERVAAWGRAAGCREFASDADISNDVSHRLHGALGFAETERVVFFRRDLAA